jgi:hypothetical protein
LPAQQFAELQARCHADRVPVAELLRRVADIAVTFGVPSKPVSLPYPDGQPEPFVFFIPQILLTNLEVEATRRATGIDDLLSEALYVYLKRRALLDAA